MTDPVVRLEHVNLRLAGNAGQVDILRDISLTVGAEETLGLIGPSGSGKSSLLMVMGGLEQASSGVVSVMGRDLGAMDEDALARFRRDHMGVVFQSFHLIPTMTALENVAVPLELAGVRDAFDRARDELGAVGLGARVDHFPGQMSGGEQQRVALARAAVTRPRILLADEPTGNLDTRTSEEIINLFRKLNSENITIILVTHDNDVAQNANRTITLRDGLVVSDVTQATESASSP